MSDVPVVQAFPKRPIAVVESDADKRRRRHWLVAALILLLPLAWYLYSSNERWSLRDDLRARGVNAQVLSAEGNCLSRRTISGDQPRGCSLTARYLVEPEHGGGERTASVYLPGEATRVFAPAVLYDPENPDHAMTERDVQRDEAFMDIAVPVVLFALLPAGALLVWFGMGKGGLAKAAAEPRPVIVAIERAERHPRSSRLEVWFRRPDGKGQGMRIFNDGGPLLVAPTPGVTTDEQRALALLAANGRAYLLDEGLTELDLTEAERETIRRAALG